jgi:hypothetical protein
LYEYQKKVDAEGAVGMSIKTEELREGESGGVFEITFIHANNSRLDLLYQYRY